VAYFGVPSTSDALHHMLPAVFSLPQAVGGVTLPPYSSVVETQETHSGYYATLFNPSQIGASHDAGSSLTVSQKQKFTIKAVSPGWGYAFETTKVCSFQDLLLACATL
jgi:hypothetical protein